uniref:Uncharacterized protein n=1 Tax=Aegilops tauschii subsp. strangulata TaxID=200361 RepID=A0A453ARH1_AEGTS
SSPQLSPSPPFLFCSRVAKSKLGLRQFGPGRRPFILSFLPPHFDAPEDSPLSSHSCFPLSCPCDGSLIHGDAPCRFMERRRRVAVLALVLLLLSACHGRREFSVNHDQSLIYDHTLAKTIVEYASAVYMTDLTALYTWTCSRCNDLTQDFEMRSLIVDVENCLQAFVGVAHNLNAIIVAIRGTQENSVQNWIKDLVWKQLDLSYPDMPNAKVIANKLFILS